MRLFLARIKDFIRRLVKFLTRDIWSNECRKSMLAQCIKCVHNQSLFKEYSFVFEIVELWT